MKKKLFFKLFIFAVIGALVTVTSCKDYDDDISNLQDQIDKLATKAELTTQLTTLQSAVTAAQTAATAAQTKADQAATAAQAALAEAQAVGDAALTEAAVKALAQAEADAAAAAAKAEVLTELAAEIEALKAELAAANEAEFEAIKAELNTKIDEIAEKAENALGLIAGAVFDVELIPTYTWNNEIPWITNSLWFSSATEKANVFSNGIANAITFVKDKQVQTGTSFIIRVSPTNVIVTPEMISFQNSLGQTYDNVKVTKVVPYEGLLTRSTANGGGLWEVFVELGAYNKADFDAASIATTTPLTKVLYAVAVTNKDNKVISAYDIDLNWTAYTPADELFFFVGDKHVKDVNNRYLNTSISLGNPGSGTVYAEKTWLGAPAVAITTSPANTAADVADDRSGQPVYPAVQGQPLKISLTQASTDAAVTKPTEIRGMYIVLDKDNAIDSAPSELNAWNSYSYTGLNTVVEGTEAEIIINSSTAINDIIGFRVYAVNYDGTLVDPDGKAFYVSLGNAATSWNAANTVVTATQQTPSTVLTTKSATTNVTLSKLSGAASFTWTTDKADDVAQTTPAFDVFFANASNVDLFGTDGTGAVTADFSKVTKIYTKAKVNDWLAYKDNKEYKGTLTIKNATGHVLTTFEVTFKKVLPAAPSGFSVKTNQIASDGVYYSYLVPDDWTAPNATQGTMSLDQVFNFGTGTLANYETTFAASVAGTPPTTATFTGVGPLSVSKEFVDNTTQHATKVVYNFGKISTETKDSGGTVIDYKVTVKEFPTVYSNIYNHTYSWNWATREQLNTWAGKPAGADYTAKTGGNYTLAMPYSTEITYGDTKTFDLGWIYGVSTRDSKYNANLDAPYLASLQVTGMKLVSNANNLDEYFEVAPPYVVGSATFKLQEKSGSTNPTADVPSTLIITAKDMYNNTVTIRLPMTVKKR